MNEPLDKNSAPGNEGEQRAPDGSPRPDDSAETIKDAHATGIGSLGRNDEKLDEVDKPGSEEAGIIKD